MADFGVLWDGRVLDLRPMAFGGWPVVFNPASRTWASFEGTLGAVADSRPITAEEAAALTSGSILSQNEVQRFAERSVSRRKALLNSTGRRSSP
ncbi:MAG: hypothetical protein AB1609_15325 [Bacillota bacterium]